MKKNPTLLNSLLIFVFVLIIIPLTSNAQNDNPHIGEDSLKYRAQLLIEQHYENLNDIGNKGFEFKNFFKTAIYIPCDYCEKNGELKSLEEYNFGLKSFPEIPQFDYEIGSFEEMKLETFNRELFEITVPVKVTFQPVLNSDGQVIEKKSVTFLDYVLTLDYVDQQFSIKNLTAKKAPASNILIAELSPNFRLSSADYSNQQSFEGFSSSAWLAKAGVSYYFNPFEGVNAANVWLKGGLRIGILQSNFELSDLSFIETEIALSGNDEDYANYINLERNIAGIQETQTSVFIEIPIGFSKRFDLTEKAILSLEVEASYSFELFEQVNGDYTRDQLGTNHFLVNSYQKESGGERIIYDQAPQAVIMAESNKTLDFYRNRIGLLDDNSPESSGFLTLSFRPSLFIRKYEKIKYQIGLNASYMMISTTQNQILDQNYFSTETGENSTTINELDQSTGHFFLGLVVGFNIK